MVVTDIGRRVAALAEEAGCQGKVLEAELFSFRRREQQRRPELGNKRSVLDELNL